MEQDTTLPGDDDAAETPDEGDRLIDRLHVPAGTFDPNIIGDAGPLDVPPGSDPPDENRPVGEVDEEELL